MFALKNELGRLFSDTGNAVGTAAADDLVPIWDASTNSVKYVSIDDLKSTSGSGSFTNLTSTGTVTFTEGITDATTGNVLNNTVTHVVSSAEVLALNATPQEIVPAPGANKLLSFTRGVIRLEYNSAAYAGIATGEDMLLRYNNSAGTPVSFVELTGFLDQTNDELRLLDKANGSGGAESDADVTGHINDPLVLHITAGEITTGDSPLIVQVVYDIINLTTLTSS